jgi:transcriptional regulator with PAS, ATPase and Fis domain
MGATNQHSFDFQRSAAGVLPVRAFRSVPDPNKLLPDEIESTLIGHSEVMQNLRRTIRMLATSTEPVLITGESGTGKELIAHAIHDLSLRSKKAFLAVNCGALTESLLESELFGHVKGAFTGATTNKKGFFEAASGSTLFLDEFAEMSLATQQRLLRVLQEGTVRPVGSTDPREVKIDTRILVATHHDLKRDLSERKFRHDLYYRVNVLQIESPPLRDRREDIFDLVQHFIRNYNDRNSSTVSIRLSPDVRYVLEAYSWPGNVRELENIIKRLALSASTRGVITAADLQLISEFRELLTDGRQVAPNMTGAPSRKLNRLSGTKQVCHCECSQQLHHYRQLVSDAGGNVAAVARQLNIKRTTLRKRILSLESKCEAG